MHVEGRQNVPPGGPLLTVSNHPGVVDAMAIWVALELRPDLKIIAAKREILQLLPGLTSRLLFVAPGTESQSALLRHAATHLRAGGALLTFPAGAIEPDPQVRDADTLETWSPSTELLVRMAPETVILPIAVSGVISRAAHHAMARRFRNPRDREWAAATLQVLCRRFRTEPRVVIGPRIHHGRQAAIRTSMSSLLLRARAA